MARRRACRSEPQALPGTLLCALLCVWTGCAPTVAPGDARRASPDDLLARLRSADRTEARRLFTELGRWPDRDEKVLAFAESETSAGRTGAWPALLEYFHGRLDGKVALLVSQVPGLEVPEQTKVDAFVLLKHHLAAQEWIVLTDYQGKTVPFRASTRGWSWSWGPRVSKHRPPSVEDVHLIGDRAKELLESGHESERVRQHARELLALIGLKDVSVRWEANRYGELPDPHLSPKERGERLNRLKEEYARRRGEKAKKWQDERAKREALESTLRDSKIRAFLASFQGADPADRLRMLSEAAGRGRKVYEEFLAYAELEIASKRTEAWPVLLKYFHGMLDRRADLLALRVVDLQMPDEIKVGALLLLKHHLQGELWIAAGKTGEKEWECPIVYGGWHGAWGRVVFKGAYVTMEDVSRIRDRMTRLIEDGRESERLRQHTRELLALIAYKDATAYPWRFRQARFRGDLGTIFGRDDVVAAAKQWNEKHEPIVRERRKRWEDEQEKTRALEARPKASGDTAPASGNAAAGVQ